jgi:hypothetical protein
MARFASKQADGSGTDFRYSGCEFESGTCVEQSDGAARFYNRSNRGAVCDGCGFAARFGFARID